MADLAAKAIRYGVSEMGLLLTVDGRDCPGCDSPQRFCPGTLTEIHVPDGVRVDDLVRDIGQIIGESGAFGRVSNTAFYLDPAQLSGLSHDRVIDLLIAVGNAVRQSGYAANVNADVGMANRILAENVTAEELRRLAGEGQR